MASVRTPRGFDVSRPACLEISEGRRPKVRNLHPAPFLPVDTLDERHNEYIVITAGTIVGVQTWNGTDYLVPANGGDGTQDITYTSVDVGEVEDVASPGDAVSSSGDSGEDYDANKPVGFAPYHYYNYYSQQRYVNFQFMHDEVTILNRYLIEIPILYTAQADFEAGDLVMPSATGYPIPFDANVDDSTSATLADDIEQICGRCLEAFTIPTGSSSRDRLDLVRTVKNSGVSGSSTDGVEAHLRKTHNSTGTWATEGVRINVLV